ncbi:MAG TPA: hypothetical protein VFX23_01910 [Limnobacter sp.]|uniref:hypothetical protein n=1 Tax=Limnobacter sp. TaxID=2003368 RepID=UPI002E3447B2|nr:hypothetical protein [Limnobacter sp.]HEX5484728.1 hypothetical protein [Limnobacter sp.]
MTIGSDGDTLQKVAYRVAPLKNVFVAFLLALTMLIQSVAMAAMHAPTFSASGTKAAALHQVEATSMSMDCHDMGKHGSQPGDMKHNSPCGQHCAISAGFLPSEVLHFTDVQSPVFGAQILPSPLQAELARLERPPKA